VSWRRRIRRWFLGRRQRDSVDETWEALASTPGSYLWPQTATASKVDRFILNIPEADSLTKGTELRYWWSSGESASGGDGST
jgi:hypothetical protein